MPHGPWILALDEDFYAEWRCQGCGHRVGFWKPGNPTGSVPTSTNDFPPENIEDWVGEPCTPL